MDDSSFPIRGREISTVSSEHHPIPMSDVNEKTTMRDDALAQLPDLVKGLRTLAPLLDVSGWSSAIRDAADRAFENARKVISDKCDVRIEIEGGWDELIIEVKSECALNDHEHDIKVVIETCLGVLYEIMNWNPDVELECRKYDNIDSPFDPEGLARKLSACADLLEKEIGGEAGAQVNTSSKGNDTKDCSKRRKRGPKPKYDPEEDRRLAEDWKASPITTYADFAAERGISREKVAGAVLRHRKRRTNSSG